MPSTRSSCTTPLPKFPASTRDIAVLVDDAVPAASMQAAIEQAAGAILESAKLFDVYKGKGIPEGKKSVAYSLCLRAPDRTLTDEECDKAMRDALAALETRISAPRCAADPLPLRQTLYQLPWGTGPSRVSSFYPSCRRKRPFNFRPSANRVHPFQLWEKISPCFSADYALLFTRFVLCCL